jgi:large subunit ribosomal protein L21
MEAYAVVETGGKQYMVRPKNVLNIELLDVEAGAKVDNFPVLALSDGKTLTIGAPRVEGAKVTALVMKHIRGPKTTSFKKRRRKTYSKQKGHRQELTVIKIESIG